MKNLTLYLFLLLLLQACFSAKQKQTIDQIKQSEVTQKNLRQVFISSRTMTSVTKVLEDGDSLRVLIELDVPRLSNSGSVKTLMEEVTFKYGLLAAYSSREFLEQNNLVLGGHQVLKSNGLFYVHFNIPKKTSISAVMVIEINDSRTGQRTMNDFLINYTVTKIREKYSLFDKKGSHPIFHNYILTKDTIQIKSLNDRSQKLIVRYFTHDFEPATPPMTVNSKVPPKNLEVDSVFTIESGTPIQFKSPGIYLLHSDTTQYYGLSFYVGNNRFPKYSKFNELINPLIYITTDEEINELKNTEEPKKEMDKLWLKLMSGNVKVAKSTIQEYYNRVRIANQKFTTYKEGWKTDMGMIYIIYGKPDRIIRTNDKELWSYTQNTNFSEINFTFIRKPNQFTDDHFFLNRFPEYEQIWYPVIENWREGKIQ